MRPLHIAILGATGVVGQEFLKLLEERQFPVASLRLLASARSAGRQMSFKGEMIPIEEATTDSFKGLDLVLSAADSGISRELLPMAVKQGAVCVDNSSAFRMDPHVPLVVPEINPDAIKRHQGIIANPNCSAIIMLMAVAPVHRQVPIKRLVVDTYQAASGAGQAALDELEAQSRAFLAGEPIIKQALPHQIAFNLFSHNDKIGDNGYNGEENKVIQESRKILDAPDLAIGVTCVRVPIHRAHSEAIHLELSRSTTPEQVRGWLEGAPGVKLVDDRANNYFPMPLDASGKDEVLVGRIRQDVSLADNRGIALFACGDQIRKGAALNAVQIAERSF